jgi:aspartyl-tRNA(Asn)/glutamyl-tRNA(Gln) amidotransferase subunit C
MTQLIWSLVIASLVIFVVSLFRHKYKEMQLSNEEVKHIAKLARLGLTDDEIKKFSGQLSDILGHAKMLEEVDTSRVEPIAQITGLKDVFFNDERKDCKFSDKLLAQSPQQIQDNMIKVKSVF